MVSLFLSSLCGTVIWALLVHWKHQAWGLITVLFARLLFPVTSCTATSIHTSRPKRGIDKERPRSCLLADVLLYWWLCCLSPMHNELGTWWPLQLFIQSMVGVEVSMLIYFNCKNLNGTFCGNNNSIIHFGFDLWDLWMCCLFVSVIKKCFHFIRCVCLKCSIVIWFKAFYSDCNWKAATYLVVRM